MVHVLGDPDVSILRMVYPLLQTAAKKRTEHVVIEAGVDTNEDAKFELPVELLELVQTMLDNQASGFDGLVCRIFSLISFNLTVAAEYVWVPAGLDDYLQPV